MGEGTGLFLFCLLSQLFPTCAKRLLQPTWTQLLDERGQLEGERKK